MYQYIKDNGGVQSEQDYPYKAKVDEQYTVYTIPVFGQLWVNSG